MPFALSDELRARLRSELAPMGVHGDDALLVMDLAIHAVNQCQDTLGRVGSTAPWYLREATMAVACSLLHNVTSPKDAPEETTQNEWAERGRGTWHPGDEA